MIRPGAALLVLLAGCAQPCGGGSAERLAARTWDVELGDMLSMGPHDLEVVVGRTRLLDGEPEERVDENTLITWQDWDNFQVRRAHGRRLRSHVVVKDGVAWQVDRRGAAKELGDPEPYRAQLRQQWNPWETSMAVFDDMVELRHEGEGIVEGRPAHQFAVGLGDPPSGRRRVEILDLSGRMWIDEATAVPLSADVTGRWRAPGRGEEQQLHYVLFRTGFGVAQVQDPT